MLASDKVGIEVKVFSYASVKAQDAGEGTSKLKVRWLITKDIGAPNFAMRLFEMEKGGNSPLHAHPWEHEVFVLKGEGVLVGANEERRFVAGDAIFVAPGELHQFRNDGDVTLTFLCLVPIRDK